MKHGVLNMHRVFYSGIFYFKEYLKKIISGFALCLCVACVSAKKKTSFKPSEDLEKASIRMEQAMQDMEKGNYTSARVELKRLIQTYPGHGIKWAAVYNLASLYKKTGKCDKAKPLYEELIREPHSRLKAHSRFALSYVYECLGERKLILKTLQSLMPYTHLFSEEKRLIEYPARLALAYIRLGEFKIGKSIQKKAHQNMERIRRTSPATALTEKNFARSFIYYGRVSYSAG